VTKPITADTITDEQIREAHAIWPEHISSECCADALGLRRGPYESPLQPIDIESARASIAIFWNARLPAPSCIDHWHCDPTTAAHPCDKPDRTKPCPICGETP
jgi:hypothetical protein